jgi:excisionase family DNA binding protein
MSAVSRPNTSDPGGGSRYRPTPAPPGGGEDRPASATDREVPRWPPAHPASHPQPKPPPGLAAEPDGPPNPGDPLAQLPELLKVREAAAILRVGRNQLYAAVARGEVPAIRIGRTIRIPKAALLTTSPEPPASAAPPQ